MISDVDIRDWERTPVELKLYETRRKCVVSLKEEPDAPFWFDHLDGMYSHCNQLDGTVWHPAAWTEVYVWSKKS